MCIVNKIHFHSIFVNIIEYGKLQGMIHISEVSPGRIRNIRDFVKEGKTIIVKVLRVNTERNQVDLSLRRVTESQRRTKVNQIKQEQVAESIIEFIAKDTKVNKQDLFNEIYPIVLAHYESLFDCFFDVVEHGLKLEKIGMQKKTAQQFEDVVKQRIKPVSVELKGKFLISSFDPDGANIIKKALLEGIKVKGNHKLTYKGAGQYDIYVTDKDYKKAETVLEELTTTIQKNLTASQFELVRYPSK